MAEKQEITSWSGFMKKDMAYVGAELRFDPTDKTFYLNSGSVSTKFGGMPYDMFGKNEGDQVMRQAIGHPVPNHLDACPVGEAITRKDEAEAITLTLDSLASQVNELK